LKTLGLIGGMSWESTVPYYQVINRTVQQRMGGLHSAKVVLVSIDFAELAPLQSAGNWHAAGAMMVEAARAVERAGAELLVLTANTMHKVAPAIEAAIGIPMLHIADPTAEAVRAAALTRVGLLGTRFTMEESFYRDRLRDRHGLEVVVPEREDREIVHRVIYEELCRGQFLDPSRAEFRRIMSALVDAGAQGLILGCTEIALLVDSDDSTVPQFDTATLHARAAAEWAVTDR